MIEADVRTQRTPESVCRATVAYVPNGYSKYAGYLYLLASADGTILGEFQRGYNFKGKLLRPSMVKVAVRS